MKKIFTFLMMLCMFVGTAWAEVFNGVYTLGVDIPVTTSELASGDEALVGTPKRGYLSYGQKGETTYNVPVLSDIPWKDYKGNSATALENGKYWYIVTPDEGDTYYFYNVGANKFMAKIGNSVQFSEEPYSWTIVKNGDYYNIGDPNATDSWLSGGCGRAPGSQFVMDDNENDGGSKYTLTLEGSITLAQVDVQFNETYDAKIGEVTTGAKAICDSYDALQVTLGTFNESVEDANKISASKVVGAWKISDVGYLANCYEKFTEDGKTIIDFLTLKNVYEAISADPEAAKVQLNPGEKFTVLCKYIQGTEVKTRGYMVYNENYANNVYLAGSDWSPYTTAIDAERIHAEWAMVSFEGKNYIYNVNNKKFMTSQSPVQFSDTPSALHFNNLNNGLWEIQFDNNNQYLSFAPGYGSNPVRTAGSTDEGNRFYIIKTGETTDVDEVGQYFVNAWKERELSVIGYVGCYSTSKEDDINAVTKLTEIPTFEENNERIALTAGQFIRVKTVANWNDDKPYLGANNSTANTSRAEFVADADKNTIFYYNGNNLISFGSGYYLFNNNSFLGYKDVQTTGATMTFQPAAKGLYGAHNIKFDSRWLFADKNDYTNAGSSTNTDDGYCFNLVEVTEIPVTISAANFASFYAPVAMTVPEGVTAYYINRSKVVGDQTWATLEEIDNDVIPAGTGVILYSETPDTYYLTVGGEATTIENNWLTGTAASTYISEESYVLSNKNGIGLYIAELDQVNNTKWLNNGFKAYLPVSATGTTSNVLRFTFGGNTTAIESVLNNSTDANAPIYDLTGRRVMNTVKGGIYIQNGKKFIVK